MRLLLIFSVILFACCTNVERGMTEFGITPVSARSIVLEFTPWLEIQPWWVGGPTIDLTRTEVKLNEALEPGETFLIESTEVTDDTLYFPFWVRSYCVNGLIVNRVVLDNAINNQNLSSNYLQTIKDRLKTSGNRQ